MKTGARRRWFEMSAAIAILAISVVAKTMGCASPEEGTGGSQAGGSPCAEGILVCEGDVARRCDGKGGFASEEPCGGAGKVCAAGVGCVVCAPGAQTCEGGVGQACDAEGSAKIEFECDPIQGMQCNPDGCVGACSPTALGTSYLGCEYWPTVTANAVWSDPFSFAVAFASTAEETTSVRIEGPGLDYTFELAPKEARALNVPWVQPLKGQDSDDKGFSVAPTANNRGMAYRVRADHPIAAYQFNPLEYENPQNPATCPNLIAGKCYSYSNDASLLLPTNALTASYHVVGHRTVLSGDLMAITATQDGTDVTLVAGPKTASLGGEGVQLTAGKSATVSLLRGEVIQLFTKGTLASHQWAGSTVTATHPVQVITGSGCANVPDDTTACDHLEEVVIPAETLGASYAVAVPRTPKGVPDTPHGGRHMVRIHGVSGDTALVFDPPSVSDATSIDAGRALEIKDVIEDFTVTGDKPFAVTQYMYGQGSVGEGDPSQSIAIPTVQFRTSYTFVAPASFDATYVNVIAKIGLTVEVDGTLLGQDDFSPIGSSGLGVARFALQKELFHRATAAEPFGIVVYAYGQYTSYMYPGGMDLARIAPPVPE